MRSVSESASTASSRRTRHLLSFLLLHAAHADECFFSFFDLELPQNGHFHCQSSAVDSELSYASTSSVPAAHAAVYLVRRSESESSAVISSSSLRHDQLGQPSTVLSVSTIDFSNEMRSVSESAATVASSSARHLLSFMSLHASQSLSCFFSFEEDFCHGHFHISSLSVPPCCEAS